MSTLEWTNWTNSFKVDWPEAQVGDWSIERFEIKKDDMIAQMGGFFSTGRGVTPGIYTGLYNKGTVIMSDTPDEIRDMINLSIAVSSFARTHLDTKIGPTALVAGLGLGCAVKGLLANGASKITVIEIDPDVIALIGPYFDPEHVEIIEADIFQWKPPKGQCWNLAWYDIWPDLCVDNLSEMATLHRRFGRRTDWQDSWGRGLLQQKKRRDQSRMVLNQWIAM